MREPIPREMELMRASCWRGTAARPMRGWVWRGRKAGLPVGRRGGAERRAPTRERPNPACCPLAARHGPRSTAARRADRAPRRRRCWRRCPAGQNRCGKDAVGFPFGEGWRVLSSQLGGGRGGQLGEGGVLGRGAGWRRGAEGDAAGKVLMGPGHGM